MLESLEASGVGLCVPHNGAVKIFWLGRPKKDAGKVQLRGVRLALLLQKPQRVAEAKRSSGCVTPDGR